MPNIVVLENRMSITQRETLRELASHGPSGSFDEQAISDLFNMGLVEVRSRRVALTERGRAARAGMTHLHSAAISGD